VHEIDWLLAADVPGAHCWHTEALLAPWNQPGLQGVQTEPPGRGEYQPAGHALHWTDPALLDIVPTGQGVHSDAEKAQLLVENVPAGQAEHRTPSR